MPCNATRQLGAPCRISSRSPEVSFNWLALGVLLAAWNAADNDASDARPKRPEALRGYQQVSVRAVARAAAMNRSVPLTLERSVRTTISVQGS
jgi:hypothetical protein